MKAVTPLSDPYAGLRHAIAGTGYRLAYVGNSNDGDAIRGQSLLEAGEMFPKYVLTSDSWPLKALAEQPHDQCTCYIIRNPNVAVAERLARFYPRPCACRLIVDVSAQFWQPSEVILGAHMSEAGRESWASAVTETAAIADAVTVPWADYAQELRTCVGLNALHVPDFDGDDDSLTRQAIAWTQAIWAARNRTRADRDTGHRRDAAADGRGPGSPMKVLITGHRGFVGSHLWRECVRRGYEVVGVDLDIDGDSWLRGGLELATDCRAFFAGSSFASVRRTFDVVFHCAATVGGRETIDGNPLAVATNLGLDAEMFNWAMRTKPGHVVYFSSSAAYPVHLQRPGRVLDETDIIAGDRLVGRPDQTYGWVKLTGEMLAEQVNAAGIPVHVFRPFSGYGTDQSPDYPFRAFLERARRRDDPFVIWGDGQQSRDWIHIDDIVAAVFAAVEQDVRGPVNLCTGVPTTFSLLAAMMCEAAGYAAQFEYLADKPVGVRYRVGDPSLMQTFYEPKISLQQGIRMALDAEVTA